MSGLRWMAVWMVWGAAVCFGARESRLLNGNFEQGMTGWRAETSGATRFLKEAAAHETQMGVRLEDRDRTRGADLISDRIPVSPDMIYEISFMCRSSWTRDNDGVGVYLVCYDSAGKVLTGSGTEFGEIYRYIVPSAYWNRERVFMVPVAGTAYGSVRFHTSNAGFAQADVDEVQVRVYKPEELEAKDIIPVQARLTRANREKLKMQVPLEAISSGMRVVSASTHPRLFASAEEFSALAERVKSSDGIHRRMAERLRYLADTLLHVPVLTRRMDGRRLLFVSRVALYRISTLALCFRIYGNPAYLDRCLEEMRAIADFSDWNPSHFLDVAEMTLAFSTGYDWLYDYLGKDTREWFARTIAEKGLKAGGEKDWWRTTDNNWGQVCHAGMIAGALAAADSEPELALRQIHQSIQNLAIPMSVYAPNGNYPEGPGYWEYGTGFNVLALSMLFHAFGTDFGLSELPGFRQTGFYNDFVTAPSGKPFSHSDCGGGRRSSIGIPWWFAQHYENDAYVRRADARRLEERCADRRPVAPEANNGWFFAYSFFWIDDLPSTPSSPAALPLVWNAGGPVPIVTMRTSWKDSEASFAGLKGGSPRSNHAHMDGGSFIYESNRIRWFADLGMEPYPRLEKMGVGLWQSEQTGERWKLFRLNNFGHNTLVLGGKLQRVDGHVSVVSAGETATHREAVLDLTGVYRNACRKAVRTARLYPDGRFEIQDELSGMTPGTEVLWGACTFEAASLSADGRRVVLRSGSHSLTLEQTLPDVSGKWRIWDASQPSFRGDSPNPGLSRVEWVSPAPADGSLRLCIRMTPGP